MHNPIVLAVLVLLLGCWTTTAGGQIKVVKKPAPEVSPDEEVVYENWVSSWGLRDDSPTKYPLGISQHKSESEAVAAAKAHIAKTAGNGENSVTHYLIEGEPSVQNKLANRVKRGGELLKRLKDAKEAVDQAKSAAAGDKPILQAKERALGDTLNEYKDMITKAYEQITEVQKTLTGGTTKLTEGNLKKVNSLIDAYNGDLQNFESVMGKNSSLGYTPVPKMTLPPPMPADEPRKDPESWLVGTSWGGDGQWYNAKQSDWYSFSNGGFVITFAEDGKCYLIKGNADTRSIERSESKWRQDGDKVVIENFFYLENVEVKLRMGTKEATTDGIDVKGDQRRFEFKQGWGLQLRPPSVSYTAYSWHVVAPERKPQHTTARPK